MSNTTVAAHSPLNTFAWLVKREYWEYRGSFFWAPIITTIVMLAFELFGLVMAGLFANKHGMQLNGVHLDEVPGKMTPEQIETARSGLDVGLLAMGFPTAIVLFFVLFIYCSGALYNDRADRSVLFWKSLPLSDSLTVLAKVASVCFVAPAFAVLATMALQVGSLLLMCLFWAFHGINAFGILWSPTHLTAVWAKMWLLIPVNALWALPSIGWLMLVSSFVRSKPFLWGMMLPIAAGLVVTMSKILDSSSMVAWFWANIVARLELSLVPGLWLKLSALQELSHSELKGPEAIVGLLSFSRLAEVLTSPSLLIGAAAGAAMIGGAIWLRRTRVEAYA
jgi:ABC-2 type transport system permease protein